MLLKKFIPSRLKPPLKTIFSFFGWKQWGRYSWSQEGEDLILLRIFENKTNGFYVDIGAHHPQRFSNTHLFYKRGWNGINIDAMPGSMKSFERERPRDINLEIGIGLKDEILEYYIFNETALNGFSGELSKARHSAESGYSIVKILPVEVRPLSKVLERYVDKYREIDFFTIDVEGLDYDVLLSNDWELYRPKYILVEILGSSLQEVASTKIGQLMRNKHYEVYAKSINTVFFRDENLSK